ncbi:hypothetical protein BOX15_Mlig004691g1, partial [Macrostomum lignano]
LQAAAQLPPGQMSKAASSKSKAGPAKMPAPAAEAAADAESAASAMEAVSLDTKATPQPPKQNGNGTLDTDDESSTAEAPPADQAASSSTNVATGAGDSAARPVPNGVVIGNGGGQHQQQHYQQYRYQQQPQAAGPGNLGPDPQALKALLERTGLEHFVTVGQRRLGPATNGEQAALDPAGREVFVGHLPRGMYEDQLYELFSSVGNVCDVRVMVDPNTGCCRGFGFVCYADKEDAAAAVEKFNGYEAATRRHLQVNITNPNLRLFVGNVPKTKSREELLADFQSHLDGVVDVIVTAPTGPNGGGGVPGVQRKNRGFCFVEFKKHSAASAARRRLQRQPRVWPAAADVWVDWADPLEEPDPAALETVRAVYVRGISPSVTEQQLAEAFAGADCGQPERVRLVQSEYAFVHFANRDAAVRAVEAMNGTELAGNQLSVSMARPVSERAKQRKEERRMARYQQMMPVQHHGPPHHPPHGHFAQHHQHPMPPPPPPAPHHHHHHQAHQPPPPPPPPPPQPQYVPAPMPQQPQVQVSGPAQIPQPQQQQPAAPLQPQPHNPSAMAAVAAQYAAAAGPMIAMAPPAAWPYGAAAPAALPDPHQAYYAAPQAHQAASAAIQFYQPQHQQFHPQLHSLAVPMPQHHPAVAPAAVGYAVPQQQQQQRGPRSRQQQQFFSPQPQQQPQFPPNYNVGVVRPPGSFVPGGTPENRGAHTYLSVSSHPH